MRLATKTRHHQGAEHRPDDDQELDEDVAHQQLQRAGIGAHLVGRCQEDAEQLCQFLRRRTCEDGDGERAAEQQHQSRDFLAGDDVAVFLSLLQLSLRSVPRFVGLRRLSSAMVLAPYRNAPIWTL
jgi:hypothetical protein